MPRLGILTGLAAEARLADRSGAGGAARAGKPLLRCGGGSPTAVARAAEELIAGGAEALLSFGVAGGLDPRFGPGTLVLAGAVVAPDGRRYAADPAWRARLAAGLPARRPAVAGDIAGRDAPLSEPAAKRRAFAASGAAAVDMESHHLARAAALSGLPFLALRAIADPAWRALPAAAADAVTADGRTDLRPLLRWLSRRPWEAGGLIGLARDYRRAMAALGRAALLGPPSFGLV